jgi:hypothetical protein
MEPSISIWVQVVKTSYDGPVILYNYSSKEIRLAATDTSYFNNHVTVNASSGGVEFGASGGVSILASGKTISVGTFSSSYLTLTKFIQLGSTAQTLTLSGTGVVSLEGCIFNGNLTINAPGILTKSSTTMAIQHSTELVLQQISTATDRMSMQEM